MALGMSSHDTCSDPGTAAVQVGDEGVLAGPSGNIAITGTQVAAGYVLHTTTAINGGLKVRCCC